MSIVEASMLGLPIIATIAGGNPEIIKDRKTGMLVEVKNSDALFEAMEVLYKDKTLRDKLGKAAREQYLEKFNFDDIVKNQYIPLYEK
jgi:glycosyltransferase involved in cell wall biosynthesis